MVLGICSKQRLREGDFSLLWTAYSLMAENIFGSKVLLCGCRYWLAQCYIAAINNPIDIRKAIDLLSTCHSPAYVKKAGLSLAELYLEGKGVPKDLSEARAIASWALLQRGENPLSAGDPEEFEEARLRTIQSMPGKPQRGQKQ